ncbi:DUF6491 family protein [Dyella sp.]|uniref:DUF6491 family protein n=1 Tax=Dyella sp. TaxID=1869338 RepID=UPI002ED5C38D
MNAALPLLALSLLSASRSAHAADNPAHAFKPLRPMSSCLRTDRIDEWHIVDARTAIVRTGPQRYLVKLQSECPNLGVGTQGLVFRPNQANAINAQGRICGEAGESVRSRDQPPCGIQSVRLVNKSTFDTLSKQAGRHGHGAEQQTPPARP